MHGNVFDRSVSGARAERSSHDLGVIRGAVEVIIVINGEGVGAVCDRPKSILLKPSLIDSRLGREVGIVIVHIEAIGKTRACRAGYASGLDMIP